MNKMIKEKESGKLINSVLGRGWVDFTLAPQIFFLDNRENYTRTNCKYNRTNHTKYVLNVGKVFFIKNSK